MAVFVYAEDPQLSGELIALARVQGQEVKAICLGVEQVDELIKFGASHVYVLQGENSWPESYARPMADLISQEGAPIFLVGATVRGRDLAAQVASYLQCGLVSDANQCCWVEGHWETSRMMYGGATVLVEAWPGPVVVTIAAGKCDAGCHHNNTAEVVTITVATDPRVKVLETAPAIKNGTDLGLASRIVGVGMGLDKKEDLQLAADLAAALGAELGCTRGVAEDRDWLPTERYIGISGAIVKPDLYLALGVSGQIQHTFGVREARVIVGINTNEKAPIFKAADYGIVGDLYEVAPLLTAAIKNSR